MHTCLPNETKQSLENSNFLARLQKDSIPVNHKFTSDVFSSYVIFILRVFLGLTKRECFLVTNLTWTLLCLGLKTYFSPNQPHSSSTLLALLCLDIITQHIDFDLSLVVKWKDKIWECRSNECRA